MKKIYIKKKHLGLVREFQRKIDYRTEKNICNIQGILFKQTKI